MTSLLWIGKSHIKSWWIGSPPLTRRPKNRRRRKHVLSCAVYWTLFERRNTRWFPLTALERKGFELRRLAAPKRARTCRVLIMEIEPSVLEAAALPQALP